jgi:uncharacterized membrane protein
MRSASPIFPWRYGMFLLLLALSAPLALVLPWHEAAMAGFDIAALAFLAVSAPLLRTDVGAMRRNAQKNDANRHVMLLITAVVSLIVLVAVGVATDQRQAPSVLTVALVLSTLAIAWIFSNSVYAFHYAHIFYRADDGGGDRQGLEFPDTAEPRYWDFIYFAFTLGMTFQTSDVSVTSGSVRKVVILHCLAGFVFNLGILAFTINVLGN